MQNHVYQRIGRISPCLFASLPSIFILILSLFATQQAVAQNYYVFKHNDYYLYNNGGTPDAQTTFTKSDIWIANGELGGTSRTLQSYTNQTNNGYLRGAYNVNFEIGQSHSIWRLNNGALYAYGNRNNRLRYVRYNNGVVFDNTNSDNFIATRIYIGTKSAATPVLNIDVATGLMEGGIKLEHRVEGQYNLAYDSTNYNSTTYYWTSSTEATETHPELITDWSDATIIWEVTTGNTYASISSDGLVTITANPTGNIVVRMNVSKGGYTGNTTITLTRADVTQNVSTATVITGPTISPNSTALYYNEGSQTFTSSASANITTTTTPAHTTLTGGGNTYYYYNNTLHATAPTADVEETPTAVTLNWSLSGAAASYLTRTPATGTATTVTHTSQSPSDLTATLTVTASASGASDKTATATITAYGPMLQPTITRSGNTISIASANAGATIYYTTDGSTPSSSSTPYTGPFDLTTSPTTVRAIVIRDGHSSTDASETFQIQLAAPEITVSNTGLATITVEAGTTVHYTTDGTTPTASSPSYSTPVQLTNPQTIMAIAVRTNYATSAVAMADYITSGVTTSKVILDDREDHNWSYYSDKPDTDYPDNLLSPDPRNVKIIYDGNGGEVSYNEAQNEFIYYKTIEKINNTYTYKVIPNPFSKRPTVGTGDARWRGFGGWKIISGAEYISGHNNNDVLDLEETLTLTGLDAGYTPNCLSATIELQATWVQAYVSTVDAAGGITSRPNTLTGDTYETNFIVILDNNAHAVSGTGRVTISNRYPDGSAGGNGTVNGCTTAADGTKVEFTNISGTFTEATGQLIVGRGCTGTVSDVAGTNADRIKDIRLESGTYSFVHPMNALGDNAANRGNFVFGCDYDRANITDAHPYGDNTKLRIKVFTSTQSNDAGHGGHANNNTDSLLNITVKSGYYGFTSDFASWQSDKTDGWGLGIGGNTDNFGDDYVVPDETGTPRTYTYRTKPPQNTMSFYVGPTRGGGKGGKNYLRIEGGELSSVNGGGTTTPDDFIRFDFRMTGGWVKGAVYGGASATDCNGSSKIVITGGEVNSWIGGGCNGTDIDAGAGATNGTIYIYAGGNAQIRSHNSDGVYNNAWGLVNHIEGGQIYGGGRGMGAPGSYSGSATNAFVVVADEAFVEQNVYGGSCHGVSQYGYVYILGGTVGKKVFGGSFEPTSTNSTWQARNTYVRMYGGLVKGGLYGGNDESGTVTQNAEVLILGGQVGTDVEHPGHVYGGGYGSSTVVTGNVNVTLGTAPATTGGATINGNVFGGSAYGNINTGGANNTTDVTLNCGTVNGNVFGGALGDGAVVTGKITVSIAGGTVNGNVYGGGDEASYTHGGDFPVVNMTGGTVTNLFGGGRGSTATITGNPQVTLSNNAHVTNNVYGGGDEAKVTGNPVVKLR